MPKYEPRLKAGSLAEYREQQQKVRDAAAEYDTERKALLERVAAKHGLPPISVTERSPYGPDSPYSFFRDRWVVADVRAKEAAAVERGVLHARGLAASAVPSRIHGDVREARQRLMTVPERRDVSAADGAFEFASVPAYIASAWADAARPRGVLASVLPVRPLPPYGQKLQVPLISTGATVAVQAEAATVDKTDIDGAMAEAPVGLVAGQADVTWQVLDRGSGALDLVIAAELGADYATKLDQEVIYGAGTSGHLRGFASVSGITEVTDADGATPTAASNLAAIGSLTAGVAAAFGDLPTVVLIHPRRYAWIQVKAGNAPSWPVNRVVPVPGLRSTLGTGSDQDECYVLAANELPLYRGPIEFRLEPEIISANGKVRCQSWGFAALVVDRRPTAVGRLTGSEFADPTW